MSQLPPGFVLDQQQQAPKPGPVYGAPPKPEKPEKPNLPSGYVMGPDGTAQRIPGLPPEKTGDGVGAAMTQNKKSEMKDQLVQLDQFEADLSSLEGQFSKSFENQGPIGTVREMLPGWANTTNQDYNETGRRLLPLVAKTLGFTSKQMDTPSELKRLEAYIPLNTDGDATAKHKLVVLRKMLVRQRANLNSQLGKEAPPAKAPATNKPSVSNW